MPVQIRFRPQNLKLLTPLKCDGINLTMKKKVYEKIITHYNKKKHVENTIKIFDSRKKNTELRTRKELLFFQVYDDTSKKKKQNKARATRDEAVIFNGSTMIFGVGFGLPTFSPGRSQTTVIYCHYCQFNCKINSLQITST